MNTNMFKKFGAVALLAVLCLAVKAASFTVTLLPNQATNSSSFINPGAAKVTQVILAANGTNTTALLIDSPSTQLTNVVLAYTNYLSYQTNYITTYTNYFGVTASFTNIAMVDYTNSVAQATNIYPTRVPLATLASTSTKYDNVNYYFQNGILFTNNSTGTATIGVTYQQ